VKAHAMDHEQRVLHAEDLPGTKATDSFERRGRTAGWGRESERERAHHLERENDECRGGFPPEIARTPTARALKPAG